MANDARQKRPAWTSQVVTAPLSDAARPLSHAICSDFTISIRNAPPQARQRLCRQQRRHRQHPAPPIWKTWRTKAPLPLPRRSHRMQAMTQRHPHPRHPSQHLAAALPPLATERQTTKYPPPCARLPRTSVLPRSSSRPRSCCGSCYRRWGSRRRGGCRTPPRAAARLCRLPCHAVLVPTAALAASCLPAPALPWVPLDTCLLASRCPCCPGVSGGGTADPLSLPTPRVSSPPCRRRCSLRRGPYHPPCLRACRARCALSTVRCSSPRSKPPWLSRNGPRTRCWPGNTPSCSRRPQRWQRCAPGTRLPHARVLHAEPAPGWLPWRGGVHPTASPPRHVPTLMRGP